MVGSDREPIRSDSRRKDTIMKLKVGYAIVFFFTFIFPIAASAAPGQLKVSGYLQSRYVNDQAQSPASDFLVRRARIKLSSDVTEDVSFVLSFDVAMKTLLKDTSVQWAKGPWRTALGQKKVPFGYEIPQGDEQRLILERDKVFEIFPSTYDRGAFLTYTPSGPGVPLTFTIAVLNGNGENSDNNDHKNLALRVQAKQRWGAAAASYYTGDYRDAAGTTTAAVRSGVDFQYDELPVSIHGEFVGGRAKGAGIQGWYLEAMHTLSRTPGIVFLRQSAFDPNTDVANDEYKRTLIGYSYHFDQKQNARLTVQYGFVNDKATAGRDNAFGLQFQVKY